MGYIASLVKATQDKALLELYTGLLHVVRNDNRFLLKNNLLFKKRL
ncbi:Uncharacterised protein [Legionella feeleii]|uniref:Uncharacterized protein n=1 Tax=Legionella feeleii TaxID=453 RepID=A0A378IVM5_9GAMM|nr:Uncharacterised protein [Legionella feeleii]